MEAKNMVVIRRTLQNLKVSAERFESSNGISEAARTELVDALFSTIVSLLPDADDPASGHIFTADGNGIVTDSENEAETIADLFDQLYGTQTITIERKKAGEKKLYRISDE